MAGQNRIGFQLYYTVDKAGLNEMKAALKQIQQEASKASSNNSLSRELKESSAAARQLEQILNSSWNSKLGQLDLSKLRNQINNSYGSMANLKAEMEKSGAAGAVAFNKMYEAILSTNLQLKQSSKFMDGLAVSMANTVKWTITSKIMQTITGSIQQAWSYAKNLDTSLNDIRIVTGNSADEMNRFAVNANKAAKSLGASTLEYTKASLIYFQQGLSQEEVDARAQVTLKAANVTGQSTTDVSEQLTAVWNGYKVSAEEAELYIDRLAAVAAKTASDLEELSIGMSKVASAAAAMGVGQEQLAAQISTIISATRQAPESIGTALKTIYARMTDIEAGLDEEVSLGEYSGAMAEMGVNVLDTNDKLRDMGEVIEEIGGKWNTFSREQQVALSQIMAGTRQYNNLIALFDNWDKYTDALNTASTAAGTLQEQQDIYMESVAAHLQQLTTEAQKTYDILFDKEVVLGFTDSLTSVLGLFNDFIQGLGGGSQAMIYLGTVIANVFNKQIGSALKTQVDNMKTFVSNAKNVKSFKDLLSVDAIKISDVDARKMAENQAALSGRNLGSEAIDEEAKIIKEIYAVRKGLTNEQVNELVTIKDRVGDEIQELSIIKERREAIEEESKQTQQQIKDNQEIINQSESEISTIEERLEKLREEKEITEQTKEMRQQGVDEQNKASVDSLSKAIQYQQQLLESARSLRNEQKASNQETIKGLNSEINQNNKKINQLNQIIDRISKIRNASYKENETIYPDIDNKGVKTSLKQMYQRFAPEATEGQANTVIDNFVTAVKGSTEARQAAINWLKELQKCYEDSNQDIQNSIDLTNSEIEVKNKSIERIQATIAELKRQREERLAGQEVSIDTSDLDARIRTEEEALTATIERRDALIEENNLYREGIEAGEAKVRQLNQEEAAHKGILGNLREFFKTQTEQGKATIDFNKRLRIGTSLIGGMTSLASGLKTAMDGTATAAERANGAFAATTGAISSLAMLVPGIGFSLSIAVNAVAGLVKTVFGDAIEDFFKTTAEKAKETQDQVKQFQQDVINASNKIKESLNNYNETKDALEELTIGTEEWNEQVQKLNENVLQLLNAFPELAQYISNINGQLSISQEGLDYIQDMQQKRSLSAQAGVYAANIGMNQQDIQKEINKFTMDNAHKYNPPGAVKATLPTDVVNKVIAAIDKNNSSVLLNKQELAKIAGITEDQANVFTKDAEATLKLYDTVKGIEQNSTLYQQQLGQIAVQMNDYTGKYADQMAIAVAKKVSDLNAVYQKDFKDASDAEKGLLKDEFAKQMGYQHMYGDNYIINGEMQEIEESVVAATLAMQKSSDAIIDIMNSYEEAFSKFSSVANNENIQSALANFAVGINDISQLTKNEVEQLKNIKINPDDVKLAFVGVELSFGEFLSEAVDKAIEDWEIQSSKLGNNLALSAKKVFNALDLSEYNLEDQQFIADTLNRAAAYDRLDEAIAALDAGNLEAFSESLVSSANNFAESMETFMETFNSLKDLKPGEIISEEEFNTLDKSLKNYFQEMLDGTYKLVGSALEFRDALQGSLESQVTEERGRLSDENAFYEKVRGYNLDELITDQSVFPFSSDDEDFLQKQIDLIKAYGDNSEETLIKVKTWEDALHENHRLMAQDLQDINKAVNDLSPNIEILNEKIENNSKLSNGWSRKLAFSYDNFKDLNKALEEGKIEMQDFMDASIALDQLKDLEELDLDELDDFADYLQDIAEESDDLADTLKNDDEAAQDVAKSIMKMNMGIDELANNWENWSSILRDSSSSAKETAEAFEGTRHAMSNLLDISEDAISAKFIKDNLDLIGEAATGSAEAIDELKSRLADDIIINIIANNGFTGAEADNILNSYYSLKDQLKDIEVGTTLDDTDFINSLNEMITKTGMSVSQVNSLFDALGFETKFKEDDNGLVYNYPNYHTQTTSVIKRIPFVSMSPNGNMMPSFIETADTYTKQIFDGYTQHSGEVPAFAMSSTGGKGSGGGTPVIDKIVKKSTGSYNNYSSANKGGTKVPGGGTKKGGGGGGGGSKGSTPKEPKVADRLKDEADRYHDINLRIKALEVSMNRLGDAQEKLTGKDLIDNLNKQLDILEQQKKAYKDKIELAKGEANELRNSLKGKGVQFDPNGMISNYASAYQAQLNYVNSVIDAYNKMTAEEQEAYEKTVEKAKKDFEEFKDQIDDYDKLMSDTIPGLEDDIQEAINDQIDIQIDKFHMEVDMDLDMSEAQRKFNEFKRKVIDKIDEDDILGNAFSKLEDFRSYYSTESGEVVKSLIREVNSIMSQIKDIDRTGTSSIYGTDRARALEDLKQYSDELMGQLEDIDDLVKEIEDSYLDMIDETSDAFDKQVDKYDKIKDSLEHDMNVITLLYGDDAYSQLDKFYSQQEVNYNKQLDFQRQEAEFWRQRMEAEEKGSDAWEKYRENWEDALDQLNSTVEDSLDNLIEKYKNMVGAVFKELNDYITNGKGLEYVNEEWELLGKNADQYLDTINGMFATQDLGNKYQDAINKSTNPAVQQRLNKLMNEQLNMLKTKDKLTQYDVDRANKLYEIALKQAELEDAQAAKTKLRLRRDTQGNYTYQFVSDMDEVQRKQEELLELQNSLYNLDKKQYKDNLDEIYEIYSEFQNKIYDLYEDNTLSEDERIAKIQLLKEQYSELLDSMTKENENIKKNLQESAFQDLANLYKVDVDNFKSMAEEEKNILMNSLVPQWNSGIQEMADKFVGEGGLIPVCQDAFKKLEASVGSFNNSLNNIQISSGQNFDDIANGLDQYVSTIESYIPANEKLINSYNQQIDAIQGVIEQLQELIKQYQYVTMFANLAVKESQGFWMNETNIDAWEALNNNGTKIKTPKPTAEADIEKQYNPEDFKASSLYEGETYQSSVDNQMSSLNWNDLMDQYSKASRSINNYNTTNIDVASMLNSIDSIINAQLLRQMNSLNSTISNIAPAAVGQEIRQNVSINATFPNATNSREIEDAFNNLINTASMYAFSNQR